MRRMVLALSLTVTLATCALRLAQAPPGSRLTVTR